MASKKMGRPTKLTDEAVATICEGLAVGLPPELACERAGIHRATFYRWQAAGDEAREALGEAYDDLEPGDAPSAYVDFCDRIKKALAECAFEHLKLVSASRLEEPKKFNWQAAAWILERRWPEFFGRRTHVDLHTDGPDEDLNGKTDEEIYAIARGAKA